MQKLTGFPAAERKVNKNGTVAELRNSNSLDKGPKAMSRFSLAFKNALEELRFLSDYAGRSLIYVRISLLFGAGQYLLFAVIDPIISPGDEFYLLVIRIFVALWIGVVLVLSYQPSFRDSFQFWVATVPIMGGIGVSLMIVLFQEKGGYHDYYVGIMLIFFYTHALLRLRFVWATLTGLTLFGMYLAAASLANMETVSLINNCFFLVSAQICGMVASYALEYYARIVFRQSKDLEDRRRLIKQQHDIKASELNDMREIQLSLLPVNPPEYPGFGIAAGMMTAAEIGGDFYDFAITKNGKLVFTIGDATGHGAKAGALVTAVKVLFVSMSKRKDLISIIKRASEVISATGLKKLYMSLAIGRLKGNRLELVGAGMPPALIWRSNKKIVEKIPLNGMPLGALADYPYHTTDITLADADMLFLMSDGLPELFNDQEEMYGYEGPSNFLKKHGDMEAKTFINTLKKEIIAFQGNEVLHDDISFIAIKKIDIPL